MKTTVNNDQTEETPRRVNKFRLNPLLVRMSFIISVIAVISTLIYIFTSGFLLHFGALPLNIICSSTLILALLGVILGSISLHTTRNVYSIIGVIVNLLIIGVQIWALIVGNNIA